MSGLVTFEAPCPVHGCESMDACWYVEQRGPVTYTVTFCPECRIPMSWNSDWSRTDPTRDAAITVTLMRRAGAPV